jgi:hypothetical protein
MVTWDYVRAVAREISASAAKGTATAGDAERLAHLVVDYDEGLFAPVQLPAGKPD